MFKYFANLLLSIVIIVFSHARSLYESHNFPPYTCDDQPIQVIFFMSLFLNFFEIKFLKRP